MLAFAMLATIRHHANTPMPKKTGLPTVSMPWTLSTGRCRKSAAWRRDWHNDASSPPISSPGRYGDALIKPL